MTDTCPFCSIAAHRADAAIVFEDADVVAFMDARPIRRGHVLLIPRIHEADLFELDPALYGRVLDRARVLGRAIRAAFRPKRVGVDLAGFDVAHAHVHLIPMHDYHDVTSRALLDGTLKVVALDELQTAATQIRDTLGAASSVPRGN
jgi:histidine triad (HIT) family protein